MKSLNKDTIINTLEFLSRQKIENANKDELIQKLCLKIQNYFPDICQICSSSYTFKLHDQTFMQCASCGQEVHKSCYLNLLKKMNLIDGNEKVKRTLFHIPGIFYLCPACQIDTINFPVSEVEDTSTDTEDNEDDDEGHVINANTLPPTASADNTSTGGQRSNDSTMVYQSGQESKQNDNGRVRRTRQRYKEDLGL